MLANTAWIQNWKNKIGGIQTNKSAFRNLDIKSLHGRSSRNEKQFTMLDKSQSLLALKHSLQEAGDAHRAGPEYGPGLPADGPLGMWSQ